MRKKRRRRKIVMIRKRRCRRDRRRKEKCIHQQRFSDLLRTQNRPRNPSLNDIMQLIIRNFLHSREFFELIGNYKQFRCQVWIRGFFLVGGYSMRHKETNGKVNDCSRISSDKDDQRQKSRGRRKENG